MYHFKMGLNSSITRHHTSKIKLNITALMKSSKIHSDFQRNLIPRDFNLFHLYGLPKIHKSLIPLRTVGNLGSPTHDVAKY